MRHPTFCPATLFHAAIAMALAPAIAFAAPPKITSIYPPGAPRGSRTAITMAGEFPAWPVQVWCDQAGVTFAAEKDKGKFQVTVAADAPAGVVWLRAYDVEGPSNPKLFLIGTEPEAEDTEPNDAPDKPQAVTLPVTINGRLAKSGDVDSFAFDLKAGQTVVASLVANQLLGSPMDAALQICRLREPGVAGIAVERVEAVVLVHNDDARGLDPQAVFTAKEEGRYLVRIFAYPAEPSSGIAFSGAETYVYRLTITAGGFLDHPLPLALQRGPPAELELRGWNLTGESAKANWPGNAPAHELTAAIFRPAVAGAWRLPIVDYPSLVAEATASPAKPQVISIPVVVSGSIAAPREADAFRFTAKKGARMRLRVESRGLGFVLDPVLSILDAGGKTLSEQDDGAKNERDPEIVFTAPADGDFMAIIRDLNHHGGLRYAYRLSILPIVPDFSLAVGDAHSLAAGKSAEIAVTVNRVEGFAEPIELRVEGLPPGISAAAVASPGSGAEAKSVKVVVQAKDDAVPWQGAIRIIGTAKGEKPRERAAQFPLPGSSDTMTAIWLRVTAQK